MRMVSQSLNEGSVGTNPNELRELLPVPWMRVPFAGTDTRCVRYGYAKQSR